MVRVNALGLRSAALVILALGLAVATWPMTSGADHDVEKARRDIEQSIRATFEAFDRDDMNGFLDGWTDRGFMNKSMFRLMVLSPFAKDDTPAFWEPARWHPIKLTKISNIMIHDAMITGATADLELIQGHLKESYRLSLIKRRGIDTRWKIARDDPQAVAADGLPVVEVKMTEHAFAFDKSRLARDMVVELVNAGKSAHEFVLWKRRPTGEEVSVARGAWSLPPGHTSRLVFTGLEPGIYVMTCCALDPDHRAHCDKGMRTEAVIE